MDPTTHGGRSRLGHTDDQPQGVGAVGRESPDAAPWVTRCWWLFLLAGLTAVAFGVVVLADAFPGLVALAWLVGLYLLCAGLLDLAQA